MNDFLIFFFLCPYIRYGERVSVLPCEAFCSAFPHVWQGLNSLVSLTDLSIACNTNRSYSIVHTYPFMLFRELPL